MEWTDEVILRLRALWAEGLSTAEIGRRLGVSKNAVVGKAHRLHLSPRPSPIRPAASRPAPSPALPARVPPEAPVLADRAPRAVAVASAAVDPPADLPAGRLAAPREAARPVALAPRSGRRSVECCWPLGDPGTANFRFCGAEATPGKPYCQPHAQLAYVKIRDRREDAA